jgi:CTP:molybdopterin cytidylyltransferase MocA/HD superfamily phosphodiesterase
LKSGAAIAAVILAAGQSVRMGGFKPLLPLGGTPVIERVARLFLAAGIGHVAVVTGHRAPEIHQAVTPLKIHCVTNPDYRQGMFTSVQTGLRNLPCGCAAAFIHPADIPLVRRHTIRRMTAAFRAASPAILYPTFDERRGHPTLIRSDLVPAILAWHGRGGLRAFLQGHDDESLELPVVDEAILLDMDTPQAYRRMAARLDREQIPSAEECRVLMDRVASLPSPIAAHCRAVSRVGRCLADALQAAGVGVDPEKVAAAALLHDIARTLKDHARAGAQLLEIHGFVSLAPLVAGHMDLEVNADHPIDEAQIVFLADKLVAGDRLVDLATRFDAKLAQYGANPAAAARIARRRENALCVKAKVERLTGLPVHAIVAGLAEGGKR